MKGKNKLSLWLVLIVIVAAVIIGKDLLIRIGVEQAVKKVTGLPLRIESLKVGITTTLIDIRGMQLFNPVGFEEKLMITIPEVFVDYNLKSLLAGKIHASDVRLHLDTFFVVKNKDGQVNINHLRTLQDKLPAKEPGKAPPPSKEKKVVPVQIDNLALKINQVVYKDFSKPEVEVREIKLGIDQTYKDIKDLNTVIGIIVVKTVAQTTLANLAGLDIGTLNSLVTGSVGSVLGEATDTIKTTTDTLKDTTEKITDIFKKPFEKE